MRPRLPIVRSSLVLLGLGFILAMPADVRSQGQKGIKDALERAFTENQGRRAKLLTGEEQANKTDVKLAVAAANWYLYRWTHQTEVSEPKRVSEIHKEFTRMVDIATARKDTAKNQEFINMLGPALVASMKEVLMDRDIKTEQATVINAAMMLPTMARLKQDKVSDYLIELVKDSKTHDVVRLYALKGLKEAMPITIQPGDDLDLNDNAQNDKRKRDTELVEALTNYIERPLNEMSAEEVDAVRYIRREAIISLAHAGAPAVLAVKYKKKDILQGAVAPTLLKVLATPFAARVSQPGDIKPPPSMQEKIEAALGLCTMKHPNMQEYNPSVAAYLIGRTIVDFMDDYNKDYANFGTVGLDRKIPQIAYRTEAKRLSDGLTEFDRNAKIPSSTTLKKLAQPILASMTNMTKSTPMAPYVRIDNAEVNILRQEVGNFRPKNGNIFKTLPKQPSINLP
jgi:hypothetical protein